MKLFDGERIRIKSIGNTHKLTITGTIESDFGTYFCKATNILEDNVVQMFKVTGGYSLVILKGKQHT